MHQKIVLANEDDVAITRKVQFLIHWCREPDSQKKISLTFGLRFDLKQEKISEIPFRDAFKKALNMFYAIVHIVVITWKALYIIC